MSIRLRGPDALIINLPFETAAIKFIYVPCPDCGGSNQLSLYNRVPAVALPPERRQSDHYQGTNFSPCVTVDYHGNICPDSWSVHFNCTR